MCVPFILAACAVAPPVPEPIRYPAAPRGSVVDNYFGSTVADPYRWLEDLDAPATRDWVAAENALSHPLLNELPERAPIRERLAKLWSFERYSLPRRLPSGALVYARGDALQNQPVLYLQDKDGAAPRVLLDPNTWSSDGTEAMVDWKVSPDGKHLAYAVQSGGTDWVEYRVMEIASGKQLPDRVGRINFNFDFSRIFWRGGNSGFFYSRFPDAPPAAAGAPPEITNQEVYWHRLGTGQKQDVLVYSRKDQPRWFVWGEVSDDGRWLVIYEERNEDEEKQVYVKDLGDAEHPKLDAPLVPLVRGFDAKWYFAGNDGATLYFRTSDHAPRYRLAALDALDATKAGPPREVVPESKDTLQHADVLGGTLVLSYLHDAASRLARYSLKGEAQGDLPLPGIGTASAPVGQPGSREMFYSYTSFNQPLTIYRADLAAKNSSALFTPKLEFSPADFVTTQELYYSKDGTRVPMFVTRRRDLPAGVPAPTLLYGYGGFSNAQTPAFSVPNLVWMERGGIYAQACLRGGSEYGEAWHRGGMLERKQNVFDDFISAAEYLVAKGYTTSSRLAIKGRSNGGLLIGAVLNQRPDLFAAANAGVGVLDMLRYHKFGIAYAWAGDYGTSADEETFSYLRAYSPVHNIKPGTRYPALLVTTGDHDDRVHPLHSYKYAAAMQAAQAGPRPILIRVDTRSGHGPGGVGTPLSKQIEENADVLGFLAHYTKG